jgi:hypothetical protein
MPPGGTIDKIIPTEHTMISPDLVQQLKDCGFPIKTSVHIDQNRKGHAELIPPTLSELIEACPETLPEVGAPDGRFNLSWDHMPDGRDCWKAWYDVDGYTMGNEGYGDTPEEAVALLWLALYRRLRASPTT